MKNSTVTQMDGQSRVHGSPAHRSSSIRSAIMVIIIVLYGILAVRTGRHLIRNPYTDLPTFHAAAMAVFGYDLSPYPPKNLEAFAHGHVFPYLYPPPSLLVIYPLRFCSDTGAGIAMFVINHLMLLLILRLLLLPRLGVKHAGDRLILRTGLIAAYVLLFDPVVSTFNHGQLNLITTAAIILLWIALRQRRDVVAGIWLAAAILLKTYPAILLVLLLIQKRWKGLTSTFLCLAGSSAAAAVALPSAVWGDWIRIVLKNSGYGATPIGLFPPANIYNQSVNGVIARFFSAREGLEEADFLVPRITVTLIVLLLSAVTFLITARLIQLHNTHAMDLGMAMILPLIYLVAPFSWDHHMVFLLPAIVILLDAVIHPDSRIPGAYAISCLATAAVLAAPMGPSRCMPAVTALWLLSLGVSLYNVRVAGKLHGDRGNKST